MILQEIASFINQDKFDSVIENMTAQLGIFKLPEVRNEAMNHYAAGSAERRKLVEAYERVKKDAPHRVPLIINGKSVSGGAGTGQQRSPSKHSLVLANYQQASVEQINEAIHGALAAKHSWEAMPFNDRAAIFLKAADLISTKYRYALMAATMIGQGKNAWQAEIDAAAELIDFFRFNCKYAEEIYSQQPPMNSPTVWNRVEYRPLEGFVLAVSPFNFTAIGGNLAGAPALMGNVVIWKPSPMAVYSNYMIMEILKEAGLPDGVIQFVPGPAAEVVKAAIDSRDFACLHFTGSTHVFRKLWRDIGNNIETYRTYPRLVGETGGKNMHFVHKSANVASVVHQTVRSAFEYQGQKCSACSRAYVPDCLWPEMKSQLVAATESISVGSESDFANFMVGVINDVSFNKIKSFIEYAKSAPDAEIIVGGTCDDSVGFFVQPTIIVTTNPQFKTLTEEIFGPVLTVFVYPSGEYERYLDLAAESSPYALTGAIFAQEREAIITASARLRNAAGNFYINDKCTGAVVGQQPFGGGRASGTNDKAGSATFLTRFVSARSIKETFVPLEQYAYPSNIA